MGKNCRVISVINWKGGVGKTTMTHHLGTGLLHLSQEECQEYWGLKDRPRVLLVDSDAQCNLSIACLQPDNYEDYAYNKKLGTLLNVYNAFLAQQDEQMQVQSCIMKWAVRGANNSVYPEVDLLPSHQDLIFMDLNMATYQRASIRGNMIGGEIYKFQVLKRALKQVRDNYDFIFIDCPPTFNFITLNALYASDYYLIPTLLDALSTYGISSIINRVDEMNEMFCASAREFEPARLLGIIPNNVREYRQEPKDSQMLMLERLYALLGTDVFPLYVTEGDGIPAAAQMGNPVYDITGTSSKAKKQAEEMLEVLREVLRRIAEDI